jgi:hypothetical protein
MIIIKGLPTGIPPLTRSLKGSRIISEGIFLIRRSGSEIKNKELRFSGFNGLHGALGIFVLP